MKRHQVRARTTVFAAAGLSLAIMSPAWADCCSSILGCAATYVTDGLSCEIETLIDTLNSIGSMITNFIHDIDGQTQATIQSAQQQVNDAYDQMQSQSQSSESDLAAALSQATALYKQEVANKPYADQSLAQQQGQLTSSASGTTAPPRPQVEARAGQSTTSGGPPLAMTAQANQNVAPAGGPANPLIQKSAVEVGTQVGGTPDLVTTPKGTFADAFSRAIQQIQVLKTAGDADFSKVAGYLQQAHSSDVAGLAQANSLANVMMAPLTVMQSTISTMLSHPWSAVDPSSVVDSIEGTITKDLSANNAQMYSDITTGPDAAFASAAPSHDELLANAQAAQTLVAVMTDAYQRRTPAAASALYAALPQRQFQGLDTKATAASLAANNTSLASNSSAAKFGQRIPYAAIAAKMTAAQQQAKLAYKAPSTSQILAAVAQFKAQRAQGKTLPPATLAAYKSKLAQQFDAVFNGKSSAAMASQRDQLIAQAKSQFAKDPSTENAVIGLLTSEASKRANTASTTTTNPTIPGQPVAATTAQRVTNNPQVGLTAPASSVSVPGAMGTGSALGAAPSSLRATTAAPLGTAAPGTAAPVATGPVTSAPVTGWTRPAAATAPTMTSGATLANPTVPGQPVSPLTQSVAPVAQPAAQVKAPLWGTAPVQSWTPAAPAPTAPTVTTVANPALRIQAIRPVQQQTQPAQAAPTAP